jgi:hypothetical protein
MTWVSVNPVILKWPGLRVATQALTYIGVTAHYQVTSNLGTYRAEC